MVNFWPQKVFNAFDFLVCEEQKLNVVVAVVKQIDPEKYLKQKWPKNGPSSQEIVSCGILS